MKDTIFTILTIGGLLIGLPLLIVCAKDQGGFVGHITKRIVGGISLLFGLVIIGWVIYNIFQPTEAFKASLSSISQFVVPLAMVGMGWRWLTSKSDE
jgi:hypothetical protein